MNRLGVSLLSSLVALGTTASARAAPGPSSDSGAYVASNGKTVQFQKQVGANGSEQLRFSVDGVSMTQKELQQWVAKNPAPRIDAQTEKALSQIPSVQAVNLLVWTSVRPWGAIARELRGQRELELKTLEERARAIRRSLRPSGSFSPAMEDDLRKRGGETVAPSPAQEQELRAIAAQIEAIEAGIRNEARRLANERTAAQHASFEATLAQMQGKIRKRLLSQSAYAVTVGAGQAQALANAPGVIRLLLEPAAKLELDQQATSLGVSAFWNVNVDGGIWDAGVLDTGVEQSHPALAHLSFQSDMGAIDTDPAGHGTAVAGIIASDNATFRGLAFGMQTMLVAENSSSGADWTVSGASDDPEVLNLSSGYGTANDFDYSAFDQFWDGLVDDNNVLVCKSTGNGGDGTTTITHPAPAYNLLAVANMDDNDDASRSNDVITSSSSRGPTLSGRKKPDMAAPGTNTMTTHDDWATSSDFVNFGGTSSAAPHVASGAILLTDLRSSDNPKANKAVLLNTADAWSDNGTSGVLTDDGQVPGTLWNKTYGWGYLDLWESHFNGLDVFNDTIDDGVTPAGTDFHLYKGLMYANEKATLVWNRHVTYNGSANPTVVEDLSDLDLYAYRSSDNTLLELSIDGNDNVEQIAVDATETVVLKVDVFGLLDPNVGVESYSLATEENFSEVAPPILSLTANPAQNNCNPLLGATTQFVINVPVTNSGDVSAFNTTLTMALPAATTLVAGSNPQNLGTIPAGAIRTATWTVSAPCLAIPAARVFGFNASSSSYGETFRAALSHSVLVF